MHTIELAKMEIERHKAELLFKSKLDPESFDYLNESIFGKIEFASIDDFMLFKDRGVEIMREIDIDDSLFLALAMSLNCPIWSNDRHFKKQDVVNAYTTIELMILLNDHS